VLGGRTSGPCGALSDSCSLLPQGYGNYNNARRLVRKLEQRGVAGVCLEDKLFPKTNSLLAGAAQPLADIDEFCGKIRACKDTQRDDDFCVVARVESFIAGWGLEETLKRAEAYRKAGADAVLIHSSLKDSSEIDAFMKEWGNRHPGNVLESASRARAMLTCAHDGRHSGDRAHQVPHHAHQALPRSGHLARHLGQPQYARLRLRHAGRVQDNQG
jgi:2-methylisocitrate lyase-like PEP mutase family enzyme